MAGLARRMSVPEVRNSLMAAGVVVAAAVGFLGASDAKLALAVAAGCAVGALVVTSPGLLLALALPGTFLLQRLGGSAQGKSVDVSDAVLLLATCVALPAIPWREARVLRQLLLCDAAYQALALPSLIENPNLHDAVEWVHRILLVSGALVAGWAVLQARKQRLAFTLLLLAGVAVAGLTLAHAVILHFQPAQWGNYQKNYLGAMMVMVVAVAHLNPPWVGIDHRLARVAKYVCLAALLATQSKQAIIVLVFIVAVVVVRDPAIRARSRMLVAAAVPIVVFAYLLTARELHSYRTHWNSLRVRVIMLTSALSLWRLDRWFGLGMHWYYLPQFSGVGQPPNIIVEELTSTGIVGTIGLAVLLVGAAMVLLRLPRDVGTLALCLVLGRVVEGIFDLYWVSAAGALPWLVAGVAVAAADRQGSYESEPVVLGSEWAHPATR